MNRNAIDPLTLETMGDPSEIAQLIEDELGDVSYEFVPEDIDYLSEGGAPARFTRSSSSSSYPQRDDEKQAKAQPAKAPSAVKATTTRSTLSKPTVEKAKAISQTVEAVAKAIPSIKNSVRSLPFCGIINGSVLSAPFDDAMYKANAKTVADIVERLAQFTERDYQKTATSTGAALTITIASADLTAAGLGNHLDFMVGVTFGASTFAAVPGDPVQISMTGANSFGQTVDLGTWTVQRDKTTSPVEIYMIPFRLVSSRPYATDIIVDATHSLSVTVTTVPSGEKVTVILPGQNHKIAQQVKGSLGIK